MTPYNDEERAALALHPLSDWFMHCLEEGPDESSTCYLALGHDSDHEWTPIQEDDNGSSVPPDGAA